MECLIYAHVQQYFREFGMDCYLSLEGGLSGMLSLFTDNLVLLLTKVKYFFSFVKVNFMQS